MVGEVCGRELCFREMERRLHFLQERIHHRVVVWAEHGYGRTREPKELEANGQGITPWFEFQEADAGKGKSQTARYQNCQTHASGENAPEHQNRHMEWKKGKEEQVQDRSDVKPGQHGDGERACRFLRQTWIGRSCRAPELCLDALAVEEHQPPDANE